MAYDKAPESSILLRLPREIRVMIYEYLLDMDSTRNIVIHNRPKSHKSKMGGSQRRSAYHVQERSLHRPLYQTTYGYNGDKELHPAIMAVNRRLRQEVAHYLYGMHSFHFGSDIEAVVPFLRDLTSTTQSIIKEITVHKSAPCNAVAVGDAAWPSICKFLGTLPRLRKLTIMVEGGQPRDSWDGPKELSVSDIRLLYATRNECLEWARLLADVSAVEEVEIVADMKHMAPPTTSSALIYAAFSASIETTFVEFLKTDLGIPAVTT